MGPHWTDGSDHHDGRANLKYEFMSPEISILKRPPSYSNTIAPQNGAGTTDLDRAQRKGFVFNRFKILSLFQLYNILWDSVLDSQLKL